MIKNDINSFIKRMSEEKQKEVMEMLGEKISYKDANGNNSNITKAEYIKLLLEQGAVVVENKLFELTKTTQKPKKAHTLLLSKIEMDYIKHLSESQLSNDDLYVESIELEQESKADASENQEDNIAENNNVTAEDENSIEDEDHEEEIEDKEEIKEEIKEEYKIEDKQFKNPEITELPKSVNKEKQKFELSLIEKANEYRNPKREKLLKEIYEKELGEYDDHAKVLLVLIENLDDAVCKKELTDRLWIGNNANRKVFEHITGLTLPHTNSDTSKYLDLLTSKDFNEEKEYTGVEVKSHSEAKEFYINSSGKFVKVEGYDFEHPELNLFIRYAKDEVIISDIRTGQKLAVGTSEKEARENLEVSIAKMGIDKIKEALAKQPSHPEYVED